MHTTPTNKELSTKMTTTARVTATSGPAAAVTEIRKNKKINDQNLTGITIPGVEEKIIVSMFADDTNLYLGKNDRIEHVQKILKEWCQASGAKFNHEKTEIIPFGSETHRTQVILTRKLNPQDPTPLEDNI
jgi:hypothetical protein